MIRIAVDGNGGDFGLETTVKGSMMAINKYPDLEIDCHQGDQPLYYYLISLE